MTDTTFNSVARSGRLGVALALTVAALGIPGRAATQQIESQTYLEHIKFLSSDELQGRGNGTPGLERAADYIAMQFRAAGLEPAGDDGTYFQKFELVSGLSVGTSNTVTMTGPQGSRTLRLGNDYEPLSIVAPESQGPAEQSISAPLVFAGYGISAPSYNYDDYAGLDVSGKAVLLLRHEPQENDERSVFQGRTHSEHATFIRKAQVARSRGARAILLVEDPRHADQTDFSRWLREPQAEEYGLPLLHVSRASIQDVVGTQLDFDDVMRGIDADLKPRSRELTGVSISYTQTLTKNRHIVRNVIGVLRGSDPARARESVVLGAHYDHLGMSGRFSLAEGSTGQVHNGADDNASGTAAIIEMAKLATAKGKVPRSLVFVAFAGEELGLLGSRHYVSHPSLPIEQAVAMINLDMVGRSNGRILVSGLDTAPQLKDDLKAAQAGLSINVVTSREGAAGLGASDDTSFLLRRVPSIFFFSGLHADYHRPSDDWDKIDSPGGSAVASLAYGLAARIAARPDRVTFVPPPAQSTSNSSGSASSGGYGPYFGSIPDFAEGDSNGVKFAEVREGSPAAKAGLQRDDVMTSFGGMPIKTLYDFTFALREKKPGDKVEVVVLRNGKEIRTTVELTNRP
ncbi:MAG TPA: M28 family peptidase [Vicinamibacterales bacterium]